jgi:uncharacterized membrane protein
MRITSAGHAVFAVTMIGLGVLGLTTGGFTAVWEPVPKYVPAHAALVYIFALVSLASGIGLLLQAAAAIASRVLLLVLLVWFFLTRVPFLFIAPGVEDSWSGCGETAVMVAGAWVLYVRFADAWDRRRLGYPCGPKGLRTARVLYGLAMLPFGAAHFIYLKETAGLVPPWLPGHTAWACFTGAAFVATGVAVLTGVCARLAALLSALELGLFTLLVWVPIVAAGTKDAYMLSETVLSVALTAAAWVVAESYKGGPWLPESRVRTPDLKETPPR